MIRWKKIIDELRQENERLKRGDFTPEEFQNLCHHRDDKPGCSREDFYDGCHNYQCKLFGNSEREELLSLIDRERQRIAELEKVLRPFADIWNARIREYRDNVGHDPINQTVRCVRYVDEAAASAAFRAAAAALASSSAPTASSGPDEDIRPEQYANHP